MIKPLRNCLILCCVIYIANAQQRPHKPVKNQPAPAALINHDFTTLFTKTTNSAVYGFIGKDYRRLRIKLVSVKKSKIASIYDVFGKSMVKGTICEFWGTLKIATIKKLPAISMGIDSMYAHTGIKGQYTLIGNYNLAEDKKQPHSGVFSGSFKTDFYIDKYDKIKYDDIDINADGYSNNEFTGHWTSYTSNATKPCNWGDFRIPGSGDLDIGAAEFSPCNKYLKNGWQTVRDALIQGSPAYQKAKESENAKWWE